MVVDMCLTDVMIFKVDRWLNSCHTARLLIKFYLNGHFGLPNLMLRVFEKHCYQLFV